MKLPGNRARSRTADLEAQRKAQAEARRRAEEARRKAAEEARRKAEAEAQRKAEEARRQQEAQRLAESKKTPNADARQDGYKARGTQPLSAETARLQGIAAEYGAPKSQTPKLDAAKAKTQETKALLNEKIGDAKTKFPDASKETREKVETLQTQAQKETNKILNTATREADKLIQAAGKVAVGKTPADQARIMAEADKRATAILDTANKATDKLVSGTADIAKEALKESHDYENKNWFQKGVSNVGNFFSNAWEKTTDVFDKAVDAVGEVVDFAAEQVGNFTDWVGDQVFELVDGALDKSPLGEDAEYTQEKTGLLGDLVTNRLEVGESAFIKLDADANISGVQLGAGAELEIKRVPATDENGNPRLEPLDEHGEPPTELEVSLVVDARAGVGLSASFGFGAATDTPQELYGNEINPGVRANAGASAEAGLQAEAEFVFTFDPNSQKDMDDLTGILGATAKTALPGIGALAAPDAVKAAQNFGSHLTSVRGELGAYAMAQASASAGIGNIGSKELGTGSELRVKGTSGKDGQLEATGNKIIPDKKKTDEDSKEPDYGLKGTVAGMALDQANLDLAELTAGLSGSVNVGSEHNFRSGETTVYLNVQGNARASASTVGDLSAGAGAEFNRTIAITLKDGEIQGIDVSDEMSGSKFHGIGDKDVLGRIQDDLVMQVSESDSVKVTRSYTPEALADFKASAGQSPSKALGNLAQSLMNPDPNPKLEVTDVKATRTDEFSFGFDVGGTGIQVGVGRRLETDLDTIDAPANLNAEQRAEQEEASV